MTFWLALPSWLLKVLITAVALQLQYSAAFVLAMQVQSFLCCRVGLLPLRESCSFQLKNLEIPFSVVLYFMPRLLELNLPISNRTLSKEQTILRYMSEEAHLGLLDDM